MTRIKTIKWNKQNARQLQSNGYTNREFRSIENWTNTKQNEPKKDRRRRRKNRYDKHMYVSPFFGFHIHAMIEVVNRRWANKNSMRLKEWKHKHTHRAQPELQLQFESRLMSRGWLTQPMMVHTRSTPFCNWFVFRFRQHTHTHSIKCIINVIDIMANICFGVV